MIKIMRIILDAVFLFCFIMIMFYFELPNIFSDNYIKHKLILFGAVFGFYYLISLIRKVGKQNCTIDPYIMIKHSLKIALLTIIGYSIFIDFSIMEWSKDYFIFDNPYKKYAIVSVIIVVLITIIQTIETLFYDQEQDECKKIC